jgi:hypothetical protein
MFVGVVIHLQQFASGELDNCIVMKNPDSPPCPNPDSWYIKEYKPWERGANEYIAKNVLWWWI